MTATPPPNLLASLAATPRTAWLGARAMVFASPESQSVHEHIERVAPTDATVLIQGETGTGKELVARRIHELSGRRGPFVAVNCGALTQSLADSELFGHQAGSFTGANETRAGWFEAANKGTLLLDEVGDLPLSLQVKLLRVLQEHEVVPVGARKPVPLDVRFIAASNVELADAVAAGNFRRDLFYRLNVVDIRLPALRDRQGDILPLVDHFLHLYAARLQIGVPDLAPQTRNALLHYAWPGNIRELENVVHVALLIATEHVIRPEHLRLSSVLGTSGSDELRPPLEVIGKQLDRLFAAPPGKLYQQLEELIIQRAFGYCGENQVQTARLLGISRNILRTLLKRVGLLSSGADPLEADVAPAAQSID
ncbi:MAG: sigma-54 dependent transcriptional regulator [Gammaproteobacteria bacterium]